MDSRMIEVHAGACITQDHDLLNVFRNASDVVRYPCTDPCEGVVVLIEVTNCSPLCDPRYRGVGAADLGDGARSAQV